MQVKTNELTEQELIHILSLPDFSWQTCGPIIERERITVLALQVSQRENWRAEKEDWGGDTEWAQSGPTPLIAAMRCYVSAELGDEINIPKELAP